jgi:acyl carrier protein
VEEALAAIWSELLGVERVGRHDNFFELGGHSLLAVRMISRVRQQLGVEASLGELFGWPSLKLLALKLQVGLVNADADANKAKAMAEIISNLSDQEVADLLASMESTPL